jgi:hypothetical protein
MSDSAILISLASTLQKVCFDYTPEWTHGSPSSYIDSVTFPKVLTDQNYSYRVVKDGTDLGVRAGYAVQDDGSQKVNFLDYNAGRGIDQGSTIKVYAVDPDSGNQYKVAQWD